MCVTGGKLHAVFVKISVVIRTWNVHVFCDCSSPRSAFSCSVVLKDIQLVRQLSPSQHGLMQNEPFMTRVITTWAVAT